MLLVLLAAFATNFLDRQVLSVSLESIKRELALSDTQLGAITGVVFAVLYSIVSIPIARWADRGNRPSIIAWSLSLLGVTVALCSTVTSFLQLALVRIGSGAGEAGSVPPAHSLLASYFERAERLRAMSVFLLGGPLSVIVGYLIGGWVSQFFGWRTAFLLIAIPGFVLGAVIRFTVREPRDDALANTRIQNRRCAESPDNVTIPARSVIAFLWQQRTFRNLVFAYTADSVFGCGLVQWLPVFLIRSHEMRTGTVGTAMAIALGVGNALGTVAGGRITNVRTVNAERQQLRVMSLVAAAYVPLTVAMLLAHDQLITLGLMFVGAFVYSIANAPSFSLIQSLAPEHMRATAVAAVFLLGNLLGLGLGPLFVGALSDGLHPLFGTDSLRIALLASAPGYLWVAAHYFRASCTVMADLTSVESANA